MKTILTGYGSLGLKIRQHYPNSEIVSFFELGQRLFEERIKQASFIIHNAASINCDSPAKFLERNYTFTKYLIDLIANNNPVVKLVYISSMSILDSCDSYKIENNMTPYAYSKFLAEKYCLQSNLDIKVVRFSTIFYKDESKDGLSKLVYNAVKDKKLYTFNGGKTKRNFVSIDAIPGKLMQSFFRSEKITNITGRIHSFSDAVDILTSLLPNIVIENVETEENQVLIDFNQLGTEFNLKNEITDYLNKLEI